ncbi:GAF domain-containing protein [Roseiarcus fermentans]|uniref:GAF domain-containing protein n=1 Tax=Roseiarcus fermentans TaxID=1473586 RepID=A0A366F375_9HYPH|nr:helix-turn-helix domain-containing protein [Roseiarcus fermentans]RBP08165.1 GAF domain-containing protein [Roseiarcus fermentans]
MSANSLAAAAKVLETVALGGGDSDLDGLVAALEAASGDADGAAVEEFRRHVAAIRRLLKDNALSERGLNVLIDTTHDLSSTLTLQDLLRTIVVRARTLVGADLAWVTVLDDESGVFRVVTAEGHLSPATAAMTSRIDYGAVSLVMKSKSFFETQDYLSDQRFPHATHLDRIFEDEKIKALAGFPILWENKVHGLLFVANRHARKLDGPETSLLGAFALHAGVAMQNANAFAMLSEALAEAERSRSALIDHIQKVEASAVAHDELTDLLASGAEIRRFLEKMSNRISGVVFLYDDAFRIQDEFASPGYNAVLADELRAGRIDLALLMRANAQSRQSGRSVVMLERGDEQCRAIALHGGDGRRDSLVMCHPGELDAIEVRNLERSAVALSIAKLWNERRETERLIASSALLRHLVLVRPPDPSTISAARDRLGLRADQPVQLAVIAMSGMDRASQTARVRECATSVCVLVDLFDDAYLAIGPVAAMQTFLHSLSKAQGEGATGGVLSEPFGDLAEAADHFGRVNRALQVLRKMKALDRFVNQREVNLFAKLFEVADAARLAAYAEQVLGRIAAKAPRQKSELERTLLVYFDAQHNIKRTAETLGLHINTVRQRLDALREMTGGWDDPVEGLELHVALRLSALLA